jgi:uncharacterized protein (DUF1330 family)
MKESNPMADVPVYLIANLVVNDADTYRNYEKGFFPLLKKHGGSFITVDDEHKTLEGVAPPPGRLVIFSFPSETAAQSWYDDPDYQALSEHRRAGTELQFLTLVHGMPPRSS